ncbi:elongation factor Tu domain 2 protein, partial [mine drainage metagenome]
LSMAHRCLLVVHALSRSVAETLATVDLFDLPTTLVRGPSVGDDELRRALKGTRLEPEPILAEDLPRLRETIGSWTAPDRPGPVRVPIDHAFQVKGVGAVALGLVAQGRLEAHAKLRLYPTDRTVEVRSIQVHDVDRGSATTGERVGVALKGIDASELERGQVLAPEGSMPRTERWLGHDPKRCRYYRGSIDSGGRYHLAVGFDTVPVRIGPAADPLEFTVDRPISVDPGSPGYLLDLSTTAGARIVGRWSLDPAGSG